MRPPNKSRSRNKNNRRGGGGNNLGNVLNRVYESAGPDGKVRGTPVQVIEKYQALAHDSSLAGDRVATENFQQHAEHYIRLMNEVQRQMAEKREAQEQQQAQRQQHTNQNNGNGSDAQANAAPQDRGGNGRAADKEEAADTPRAEKAEPSAGLETISEDAAAGSGLVETPEAAAQDQPAPKPRRQRQKKAAPKAEDAAIEASPEAPPVE